MFIVTLLAFCSIRVPPDPTVAGGAGGGFFNNLDFYDTYGNSFAHYGMRPLFPLMGGNVQNKPQNYNFRLLIYRGAEIGQSRWGHTVVLECDSDE